MPLNPIAAVLVAAILLLAIRNNSEQELISLLSEEGGFIKWMVALGVVLWMYNAAPPDGKKIIGGILFLAVVSTVMQSQDAIAQLRKLAEI